MKGTLSDKSGISSHFIQFGRANSIIRHPRNEHRISDIVQTILPYISYKTPSHRTFCLINRKLHFV